MCFFLLALLSDLRDIAASMSVMVDQYSTVSSKLWYVHFMECNLAMKRNTLVMHRPAPMALQRSGHQCHKVTSHRNKGRGRRRQMAGNTEDTRDPLLDYMYDKTELAIQIGTNQVNWADLSMTVEPQSLAKAKASVRAQDSSPAHLLTRCGYRNHKTETKKQLHSGCNSADNYFLKGESQASTLPQKT